jgi:signal peptidase II
VEARLAIAVGVAAATFSLDLWSKEAAFAAVPTTRDRVVVVEDFFHIAHVRNPGMAWSLFQGVDREFWVVVRTLLSAGIAWLYATSALKRGAAAWAHMGFGFVFGGALGNLADNVFAQDGHVRDFLLFFIFGRPFPVFNVADAAITVGAPLLFVHLAIREKEEAKERARRKEEASAAAGAPNDATPAAEAAPQTPTAEPRNGAAS